MNKYVATFALMCVLLVSIIGVQAAANQVQLGNRRVQNQAAAKPAQIAELDEARLEELKAAIPENYETAEEQVTESALWPGPSRFLLWTRDLEHIIWGSYAYGRFYGTDTEGVRVWGIYGNNFWAGFYGSEFFYGKYSYGWWSARYLFGEEYSSGGFITFPGKPMPVEAMAMEE
ncbi:hypothetical protein KY320_01775 [Candidatus Woesearchaeota archaeon]|nr:hypothetical protein [Candidatus Woesearchaeota archaeon]